MDAYQDNQWQSCEGSIISNPLTRYGAPPEFETFSTRSSPAEAYGFVLNSSATGIALWNEYERHLHAGRVEIDRTYVSAPRRHVARHVFARAPAQNVFGQAEVKIDEKWFEPGARMLLPDVVSRLKEQFSSPEGSDCAVCMERPDDNDLAIFACGHGMCLSCIRRNVDANPEDARKATTCPHCRVEFDPRKTTTKKYFMKVHCPPQHVSLTADGDVEMSG